MKLSMITELHDLLPDQQHGYQFGDCSVEVYMMVKRAITKGILDFVVVDSMVMVDNQEIPHSWIERGGKIIDPTVNQFGGRDIEYSPSGSYRDEFSPTEYVEYFEEQYGINV
jgi:hypothetical protein